MPSPDAGATTPAASPASTTSRPLSQRGSGFIGNRRAFAAQRRAPAGRRPRAAWPTARAARSPCRRCRCRCSASCRAGTPSRRSRATACRGRHVAARGVVAGRAARRACDDLVVREDVRRLLGAGHGLARHFAARAVGADHAARAHRWRALGFTGAARGGEVHHAVPSSSRSGARSVPLRRTAPAWRRARAAIRRRCSRSTMPTKPPSIGMSTAGRLGDTMRAQWMRHQQVVGDGEVLDQPRRDGAAAGLDAPGAVEQQHRAAARARSWARWRRRAAADHHHVEGLSTRAHVLSPGDALGRGPGCARAVNAGTAMRAASTAATTNSTASQREHAGIGGTCEPDQPARQVAGAVPMHAAQAKGDGLRRAPQAHACAFARGAALVASAIIDRWRRSKTRRWPRPARTPLARSGQAGPPGRPHHQAAMAAADARQPPTDPAAQRAEGMPASAARPATPAACPASTPPCCTPDSCVDSPGVKPNTMPAKGSRIRSCAL
jgi:hypothetical protein